jgi:hypothetical protein
VPVDDRRNPQQYDKGWIPGCVEQVTGDEQIGFLGLPAKRCVMQRQDQYEEHHERERIK